MLSKKELKRINRLYNEILINYDFGDDDKAKNGLWNLFKEEYTDLLIDFANEMYKNMEKIAELNSFLSQYSSSSDFGKHVIDVAMDVIKEQERAIYNIKNWG